MILDELQEQGLSKKEAEVYLLLVRYGMNRASGVYRLSGDANRTQVYAILDGLVKKGYADRVLKNGKSFFVACEPEVFVQRAQSRFRQSKVLLEDLHNIQLVKSKPVVRTFEGLEGLTAMTEIFLDEAREQGGEMLQMGQELRLVEEYPELIERFISSRKDRKIPLKLLCTRFQQFEKYLNPQRDPVELREVRLVDPEKLDVDCTTYLYGDSIAVISLSHEMQGFIFTSPNVAMLNRKMFFLLWDSLPKPY
jgi:sugar-specific transcriptional regulator TrmB